MNSLPPETTSPTPVAAELLCPATGARATGRVYELTVHHARVRFGEGTRLEGFDVGATVNATFVSSVLGGSRTLKGRVVSARDAALELRFESGATTPTEPMFLRRNALRLRPEALPIGRTVELAWAGHEAEGVIDDISMKGVAFLLNRKGPLPEEDARVRVRLSGPNDVTAWLSGRVRHIARGGSGSRVGVEFDLRMADVEGAGPALREIVRQIERLQVDELVLAFAGIAPGPY